MMESYASIVVLQKLLVDLNQICLWRKELIADATDEYICPRFL